MKARQKWGLLIQKNKDHRDFRMLKCLNLANSTDHKCKKSN